MKFFKKRNKTLKYIEKLALENVENKKRIAELEDQVSELFGRNKLALGQIAELEKALEECGNVDGRLTYLENNQLNREAIEDIVNDCLPSNLADVVYTYDSYDFDEFMTADAVDDELRSREYVTTDELKGEIEEYIEDIKDDIIGDVKGEVKEMQTPKWDDPEQFMLFLNKLAKYVVSQTSTT